MMKVLERIILFIRKKIARYRGKSYIRSGSCNCCGFCCTMVTLFIDGHPISTEEEFAYLQEIFSEYRRFFIRGRDADGHLMFTCKYLSETFTCTDYKGRPSICRDYPNQDLFLRGGKLVSKCGYEFVPVEDFQKVFDGVMGRASRVEDSEEDNSDMTDDACPDIEETGIQELNSGNREVEH